jgi:GNAT superfamily N-acetyltransferase
VSKLQIRALDIHNLLQLEASIDLVENAFADPDRYGRERIVWEMLAENAAFYRQFFIATRGRQIVGVAGVKAADWALKTHLLYLSAVAPEMRGKGIGHALLDARLEWIKRKFDSGRILVSTARTKRFRECGFVEIPDSEIEDRHLMLYRF